MGTKLSRTAKRKDKNGSQKGVSSATTTNSSSAKVKHAEKSPSSSTGSTANTQSDTSSAPNNKRLSFETLTKVTETRSPTETDGSLRPVTNSRKPPVFTTEIFGTVVLRPSSPNSGADYISDKQRKKRLLDADSQKATEITPFLCVGGQIVAKNKELLVSTGITHVLNTAHAVCQNYHKDDARFTYLDFNLIDSANESISCFILQAISFIEQARKSGGKCLVHCHQGVSRSCTLVIAYVMWYQHCAYTEAFHVVKAKRKVCRPNSGFTFQLLSWQRRLGIASKSSKNSTVVYDSLNDGQEAFEVQEYAPRIEVSPITNELYRIARHSERDATLVAKLCTNDSDVPVDPQVSELDTRGVFLIYNHIKELIMVYVGENCSNPIEYLESACRIGGWMISLEPRFKGARLVIVSPGVDQSEYPKDSNTISVSVTKATKKDMKILWETLGSATLDGVPSSNPIYDNEYGAKKSPKNSSRQLIRAHESESDDDVKDHLVPHLFVCDDGKSWERRKVYDDDDLTSTSMAVLFVHDRSKYPDEDSKQPAHQIDFGTVVVNYVFVWLGADIESILNFDAAMELATKFVSESIQQSRTAARGGIPKIEQVNSGNESASFWEAFQAGY